MKRWLTGVILVAGVTMAAGPLFAHHGTGISYNLIAPLVTIKGTVTEFAWRNPHVSIFIDVKDETSGGTACSGESPTPSARR